jgi:formate-dependent phosphoribosylglycinamide formyltransferase (GAR transformylase)
MVNSLSGKKILILGAGTWLIPHIIKANKLGLLTYVTDWSDTAEGKKHAYCFKAIDLKDKEATLNFAKESQIDAIYTSADIGVQTAAYVARNMNLPYHTEELAYNATNKGGMRNIAKNIGLPIPNFYTTNNLREAIEVGKKNGYPIIIKPVDNFSSRGVSVLNSEQDLIDFFDESLSASFEGKVILEEFMTGTEGSVEAVIQNGSVHILGICSKLKSDLPYRYDLQLNYPGEYSPLQNDLIITFINKLVKGFEIKNGIIHVEIMVGFDSVKLIEFGIRGCGSKVITHLIPAMTEFDVVRFLIVNSFQIEQDIVLNKNRSGVLKFIMLDSGVISKIEGIQSVKKIEGVIDFDIERKVGDQVGLVKDGRTRPGYLLAVADNKFELNNIVEKVNKSFSVTYNQE